MPYDFKRSERLTDPRSIQFILRSGKSFRQDGFVLKFLKKVKDETGRFSVSVKRGAVKSAVERNRIRRLAREFYRLHKNEIAPSLDIVVLVTECKLFKYREIEQIFNSLFKKSGILR